MIFDSYTWKRELKKELKQFKKFTNTTNIQVAPPESGIFFLKIEKFFFVTAYIIRKLNESNKLSDELVNTRISVTKYPRTNKGELLDFMNNHHTERFFDFKKKQKSSIPCLVVCNYLIHSFIFDPIFDDKDWKVVGIQVTSDRSKSEALYYISLGEYLGFLEEVINDQIVKIYFNRVTGENKKSRNR
jgi:hypothetical protein